MKSISLYVDNGSWLCKVHPFTKLAYIATAISVPLLVGKLSFFAIFIALSLAVLASGRLLKRVVPLIAFSFMILITIFLIHGLFNQSNRNILFSIGPLHFYREGLLYALHIGCNVLNMLLSLRFWCSRPSPPSWSRNWKSAVSPAGWATSSPRCSRSCPR